MSKRTVCIFVFLMLTIFSFICLRSETSSMITLLNDRFANNDNLWAEDNNDIYRFKIKNNATTFEHKRTEGFYMVWIWSYMDVDDPYIIETEITHKSGTDDYGFGLIWGVSDVDNFHTINLSGNGYYRIGKTANSEWSQFVSWTPSSFVRESPASNIIRLAVQDDMIKFYLNGFFLTEISNEKVAGDGVGFVIWKNQTIEINNLIIQGTEDEDLLMDDYWYYGE